VPIRYCRVLTTPFAFFRGGAALMAVDLGDRPRAPLEVQLCGDAHVSNCGGFMAPDRRVVFDPNDFDETLAGPFEWDVKRLAASLAVGGRTLGLTDAERGQSASSGSRATAWRCASSRSGPRSTSGTRGSTSTSSFGGGASSSPERSGACSRMRSPGRGRGRACSPSTG
jgi:hypothetical protein